MNPKEKTISDIDLQRLTKLLFGLMFIGGFIWMGYEATHPPFNEASWVFTALTGIIAYNL